MGDGDGAGSPPTAPPVGQGLSDWESAAAPLGPPLHPCRSGAPGGRAGGEAGGGWAAVGVPYLLGICWRQERRPAWSLLHAQGCPPPALGEGRPPSVVVVLAEAGLPEPSAQQLVARGACEERHTAAGGRHGLAQRSLETRLLPVHLPGRRQEGPSAPRLELSAHSRCSGHTGRRDAGPVTEGAPGSGTGGGGSPRVGHRDGGSPGSGTGRGEPQGWAQGGGSPRVGHREGGSPGSGTGR